MRNLKATVVFALCACASACGWVALITAIAPSASARRVAPSAMTACVGSASSALAFRIVYTFWSVVKTRDAKKIAACASELARSNGFQYCVYGSLILGRGASAIPACAPFAVLATYQTLAHAALRSKDGKSAWSKAMERVFARAQESMEFALVICATLEISALTTVLLELATPRRSFGRLFAFVFWLRSRYHCKDNTVFRIKFTAHDTSFYHREVWRMLDEKIGSRAPAPVRRALAPLTNWFTTA